jgi:catechol 2,3-dioxygenase-like lactoylglutathione lyase family enzyme
MKIEHLNHVALHVADVDRSVAFYRDGLRLQPLPRPAFTFPGEWFRLGTDQELHLIGERQKEVVSHHRGDHFALRVDDIDAWEQHFIQQKIAYQPRKIRPDGAYQIFVIDPDGHWIEFCSSPGMAKGSSY